MIPYLIKEAVLVGCICPSSLLSGRYLYLAQRQQPREGGERAGETPLVSRHDIEISLAGRTR
jgi:hypothetical protein